MTTQHENSKTLYIHVNQVALELTGPKKAIISANYEIDLAKASFQVVSKQNNDDSGSYTYQGNLLELGQIEQWQKAHQSEEPIYYYAAEFSAMDKTGDFVIVVSDEHSQQVSAKFSVEKQALFNLTAKALLTYLLQW
ncbi:cellulase N-terminal Ig-like domain-containing protein [Litorilituus lipolyticus]|nr:cellulase N-terminal Ig-like domain-containing protein [Litorilituus lipolyticus]